MFWREILATHFTIPLPNSPLHLSAPRGLVETTEALLARGGHVSLTDSQVREPPFFWQHTYRVTDVCVLYSLLGFARPIIDWKLQISDLEFLSDSHVQGYTPLLSCAPNEDVAICMANLLAEYLKMPEEEQRRSYRSIGEGFSKRDKLFSPLTQWFSLLRLIESALGYYVFLKASQLNGLNLHPRTPRQHGQQQHRTICQQASGGDERIALTFKDIIRSLIWILPKIVPTQKAARIFCQVNFCHLILKQVSLIRIMIGGSHFVRFLLPL